MVSWFETNHHEESVSECDRCRRRFVIQKGGQKSGKPPVVRVVGNNTEYYCSSRCLAAVDGVPYEETLGYQTLRGFGVEPDEVFYPGYLAPARRIKASTTS